jgi:hypothetical protein
MPTSATMPTNFNPPSYATNYDPSGNVPPRNYEELYSLMEYRGNYHLNVRGTAHVTASMMFSKDDIVNKIAKEMLFAYIFDHKEELPTAYRGLNVPNGNVR